MVKVAAAIASGLVLVLLIMITGGGSGAVTSPPNGGCAVTVAARPDVRPGVATGPRQGRQLDARLNAEQMAAARTVIAVGKELQISRRGIAMALATAMQESSLQSDAINGRSEGLFQQQGEYYADVDKSDPVATAAAFYRMLLDRVPNYDNPDITHGGVAFAAAAQAVQASGAGAEWYARWEQWATTLTTALYDGTAPREPAQPPGGNVQGSTAGQVTCTAGGGPGPVQMAVRGSTVELPPEAGIEATFTFPTAAAATAAAAALSYLGTTYSWGGGGPNGPTKGIDGNGAVGFDCSGLTQYAYAQAGIALPRVSEQQRQTGRISSWKDADPGDLLFWGSPVHHVALYLGESGGVHYMVEAPSSGSVVRVVPVRTGGDFQDIAVQPYEDPTYEKR